MLGRVLAARARGKKLDAITGRLNLARQREHVGCEPRLQQHRQVERRGLGVRGSFFEPAIECLQHLGHLHELSVVVRHVSPSRPVAFARAQYRRRVAARSDFAGRSRAQPVASRGPTRTRAHANRSRAPALGRGSAGGSSTSYSAEDHLLSVSAPPPAASWMETMRSAPVEVDRQLKAATRARARLRLTNTNTSTNTVTCGAPFLDPPRAQVRVGCTP